MAKIEVFNNQAFVHTGHNIIKKSYYLPVKTKCTAIIEAVSQGDKYGRAFEVYSDEIIKHKANVANSVRTQVNLGLLEIGWHTLGIKLTTFVGSWIVNANVEVDAIESPTIAPTTIPEEPTQIAPSIGIAGPAVLVPPATDFPESLAELPPSDSTGWEWLTLPAIGRVATQEEIDARNRDTNRAKAIAETGIVEVAHLDIIPSPNWMESTSIPLSVQAVNDRLKDIPTGWLPQLEFASGLGRAEYGPTELGALTGVFNSHKDNYGRDMFSIGDSFSMEPSMLLLGAGLAALAAAVFFKRNEITKLIKR